MTDIDFNPVVWVSLASRSGLSLVSLGHPGLRTDVDEQVYTGGLTAVQQILGGEIGGDTTRFVGGGQDNKTGRFLVQGDGYELVGQFLLISSKGIPVAPSLVEYYEHLVISFAEETLKTDLVRKAEEEFRAFTINDVLDFFLSSIIKTKKQMSLPLDSKFFTISLKESLKRSINEYEYSSTLVKISNYKGKYPELCKQVAEQRKDLIIEFEKDLFEFLVSEYPHSLVMYPKINSLQKDFSKLFRSEFDVISLKESLNELIQDFEKKDLTTFLEDYSLHEVTKENLRNRLEEEIFRRFIGEFPLLFLADPEINGFSNALENFSIRINETYDLGGTLTRISQEMMKDHPKEEQLITPCIRHFCDQFSTGLPLTAWKYLQIVFKLISMEIKTDIMEILSKFKTEIPHSHFTMIENMLTKHKLTKIAPLSFTVKSASDAIPFYRALFDTLGFSVNMIISKMVFGEFEFDNYFKHTFNKFQEFSIEILNIFSLFSLYSYFDRIQNRLDFGLVYPDEDILGLIIKDNKINPETFIENLIKVNIEYLEKEPSVLKSMLDEFHRAFNTRIDDIEKYLSEPPVKISKGYLEKFNENELLFHSHRPLNKVDEFFTKVKDEYKIIIEQIKSELNKITEIANEFLSGKIKEDKFHNSILLNRDFLRKSHAKLNTVIQKANSSIEKEYKGIKDLVNKQINKLSKDISKELSPQSPFLNIDKKAFNKGDDKFLSDPTAAINDLTLAICQKAEKSMLSWDNLGNYFFYSKNRLLPSNLQNEISNALAYKKSYHLLKETIETVKDSPSTNIFRAYSEVLENYAKEKISSLYGEVGKILDKKYMKSDPDIFFVGQNNVTVPVLEIGILKNKEAAESLVKMLGSRIIVEEEHKNEELYMRIFAVIPSFQSIYKNLKNSWKGKDWTLRKVLLYLSWYSLLESNRLYLNLLHYSADLYSVRVRESIDEIFEQVGRAIISNWD